MVTLRGRDGGKYQFSRTTFTEPPGKWRVRYVVAADMFRQYITLQVSSDDSLEAVGSGLQDGDHWKSDHVFLWKMCV